MATLGKAQGSAHKIEAGTTLFWNRAVKELENCPKIGSHQGALRDGGKITPAKKR